MELKGIAMTDQDVYSLQPVLGLLPLSLQPARHEGVEVDHLPSHHLVPPHTVKHAVIVVQSVPTLQCKIRLHLTSSAWQMKARAELVNSTFLAQISPKLKANQVDI